MEQIASGKIRLILMSTHIRANTVLVVLARTRNILSKKRTLVNMELVATEKVAITSSSTYIQQIIPCCRSPPK
jgi:hypothetical protein